MGETNEECEERVEERSNTQAHDTWKTRRALTPWANVVWDTIISADKHEKMWRVTVFCSQVPVTEMEITKREMMWAHHTPPESERKHKQGEEETNTNSPTWPNHNGISSKKWLEPKWLRVNINVQFSSPPAPKSTKQRDTKKTPWPLKSPGPLNTTIACARSSARRHRGHWLKQPTDTNKPCGALHPSGRLSRMINPDPMEQHPSSQLHSGIARSLILKPKRWIVEKTDNNDYN